MEAPSEAAKNQEVPQSPTNLGLPDDFTENLQFYMKGTIKPNLTQSEDSSDDDFTENLHRYIRPVVEDDFSDISVHTNEDAAETPQHVAIAIDDDSTRQRNFQANAQAAGDSFDLSVRLSRSPVTIPESLFSQTQQPGDCFVQELAAPNPKDALIFRRYEKDLRRCKEQLALDYAAEVETIRHQQAQLESIHREQLRHITDQLSADHAAQVSALTEERLQLVTNQQQEMQLREDRLRSALVSEVATHEQRQSELARNGLADLELYKQQMQSDVAADRAQLEKERFEFLEERKKQDQRCQVGLASRDSAVSEQEHLVRQRDEHLRSAHVAELQTLHQNHVDELQRCRDQLRFVREAEIKSERQHAQQKIELEYVDRKVYEELQNKHNAETQTFMAQAEAANIHADKLASEHVAQLELLRQTFKTETHRCMDLLRSRHSAEVDSIRSGAEAKIRNEYISTAEHTNTMNLSASMFRELQAQHTALTGTVAELRDQLTLTEANAGIQRHEFVAKALAAYEEEERLWKRRQQAWKKERALMAKALMHQWGERECGMAAPGRKQRYRYLSDEEV